MQRHLRVTRDVSERERASLLLQGEDVEGSLEDGTAVAAHDGIRATTTSDAGSLNGDRVLPRRELQRHPEAPVREDARYPTVVERLDSPGNRRSRSSCRRPRERCRRSNDPVAVFDVVCTPPAVVTNRNEPAGTSIVVERPGTSVKPVVGAIVTPDVPNRLLPDCPATPPGSAAPLHANVDPLTEVNREPPLGQFGITRGKAGACDTDPVGAIGAVGAVQPGRAAERVDEVLFRAVVPEAQPGLVGGLPIRSVRSVCAVRAR